jgi:gamma-glutamyltranspeptidase/glutathione hydrolase
MNRYEPGKRPFHTIIPGFAIREDARERLAFGVMGAAMQPQGHVLVLTNMLDFGMDLQEAGDAPRIRHEGSTEPTGGAAIADGGTVHVERGIGEAVRTELRRRGHLVHEAAPGGAFGGYQAVLHDVERGVFAGASESRKDGYAAGY